MKRRGVIRLLAGAAVWPVAARAQRPPGPPTIGFLAVGSRAGGQRWADAFVERLGELGWQADRTLRIEWRWADGRSAAIASFAAEFVRLGVDVIVTTGAAAPTVKAATSVIPIVLAGATNPIGDGLVESLARPGTNVTGLSAQAADIARKRFELLREIVPAMRTLAMLVNTGNAANRWERAELEAAARAAGIGVVVGEIRGPDDLAPRLAALRGRCEALYVCTDPVLNTHRAAIADGAIAAGLPAVWGLGEAAQAGGLLAYGPSFPHLFRRVADYVDRILRGAKPGDLPVEQPSQFDLTINLATAKALGIALPASLLARADVVIE